MRTCNKEFNGKSCVFLLSPYLFVFVICIRDIYLTVMMTPLSHGDEDILISVTTELAFYIVRNGQIYYTTVLGFNIKPYKQNRASPINKTEQIRLTSIGQHRYIKYGPRETVDVLDWQIGTVLGLYPPILQIPSNK